jgi:hypothetical protein
MEVRKQYQTKISIRFAALENLNYNEDIDTALENLKDNNNPSAEYSLGLYEVLQH